MTAAEGTTPNGVPWGWGDKAPASTLAALIRHAGLYTLDVGVARDADTLLDAAGSVEDRDGVRQYLGLRRKAPGFSPDHRDRSGHFDRNSHASIPAAALAALLEGPHAVRDCIVCGRPFRYHRVTARCCSATCRQRAKRKVGVVAAAVPDRRPTTARLHAEPSNTRAFGPTWAGTAA